MIWSAIENILYLKTGLQIYKFRFYTILRVPSGGVSPKKGLLAHPENTHTNNVYNLWCCRVKKIHKGYKYRPWKKSQDGVFLTTPDLILGQWKISNY